MHSRDADELRLRIKSPPDCARQNVSSPRVDRKSVRICRHQYAGSGNSVIGARAEPEADAGGIFLFDLVFRALVRLSRALAVAGMALPRTLVLRSFRASNRFFRLDSPHSQFGRDRFCPNRIRPRDRADLLFVAFLLNG